MLHKIVKCRIIMADGFQIEGDLRIGNVQLFERWINKNIEYDRKQDITEIVFEMMKTTEVKNGRKGKEF